MTKKFIFIPVVNNFHLLQKAINSVPPDLYNEYFVVNNSNVDITKHVDMKQFTVFPLVNALSFKDTQNKMRQYAIDNDYDYYSFMHNDGEILDDSAYRLISLADKQCKENAKWGAIFTKYDVFCAFSTNCVKKIGEWGDSRWPLQKSGYYLDNDYYRRVCINVFFTTSLKNANVLHNEPSNTLKDANELQLWRKQRKSVEDHYIFKWGGLPGKEWLDPPFDTRKL
jgi:hypothetical protein